MVDEATAEDVISGDLYSAPPEKPIYNSPVGLGMMAQIGGNPLEKIDWVKAMAPSMARFKDGKMKTKKEKKEFELKKLFKKYVEHYAEKWDAMKTYPKQIKQKPAWFDLALSKFKDEEISMDDKKKIKTAFNTLWEFRDANLPERIMNEEEANRQYGINSPYYTPPEVSPTEVMNQSTETFTGDALAPTEDFSPPPVYTPEPQITQPMEENDFGVRKVVPAGDSYLSNYIIPMRKTVVNTVPEVKPTIKPPQGNFTMGITEAQKLSGGSGSGAFSIGRNIFAGIRGRDSLQGIINPGKPNLPEQSVQVKPDETITVAQTPEAMQRSKKTSRSGVDRKIQNVSVGLNRFRSIELPTFPKAKMPSIKPVKSSKKSNDMKINSDLKFNLNLTSGKKSGKSFGKPLGKIKSHKINTSFKMDKKSLGNMSSDVRGNVNGVVGGINKLKNQVRGEFKSGSSVKSINLKNIKSKKFTDHKDMNVLRKLKSETHNQISREALECKMIPKLKAQCDKVFTKNHVTNEVSKFRSEFKDIGKLVPTVKGDKAKISEISMLGKSITHGVDGAQVADVRAMYKNSGSTKQMSIGRMEYDYSFVTGKKKPKIIPMEEYYEEDV
jgi:hypothetical protein